MRQILEGSQVIAQTIKMIKPDVISAYPITPQTHIVEDLAKFKADGEADFEFVRAESEFAAASIVAGAAAAGVRTYTATSSQGLLLMMEVLYNIAGMRLPVVITVANRGVSAPITIWNDHQDAMSMRDAGWIQFFAENHQEAVEQHLIAYKVAEQLGVPAAVNVDGFVLTHTYEGVSLPKPAEVKRFLPPYKPAAGTYLDPKKPVSFGAFAPPEYYMEIRQELHTALRKAQALIKEEYRHLASTVPSAFKEREPSSLINNGLIEYYGPKNPKIVLVAMGSLCGTIKDVIDIHGRQKRFLGDSVGLLKLKVLRPLPAADILRAIGKARQVAVLEKAVSLGANAGPLALDIRSLAKNHSRAKIQSFIVGLGGRDITKELINKVIVSVKGKEDKMRFVG